MSLPAASAPVHGYQVPGSYQLSICRSGCTTNDARTAFSTVVVVLSMRPMAEHDPRPPGKGCYAVKNLSKSDSYVQIETTGETSWTIESGKLKFALFRSPDAGYFVVLEMKDGTVSGVGKSRGAGLAASKQVDRVVGYRMSPPEPELCDPSRAFFSDANQKFIPQSPLDETQAANLKSHLEKAGLKDLTLDDLIKNVDSNHTFHDADIFAAYPQLRGQQKLSECSNRMMSGATELIFLESKGRNEATLETLSCAGAMNGIKCPVPKRGQYYFLDGTGQYFMLDGLTFATAREILDTYAAGRITGLPQWMNPKSMNVTSIKALFDNRYQMIFGEFYCAGCSTRFDVDLEKKDGSTRLNVVGQPSGGCY